MNDQFDNFEALISPGELPTVDDLELIASIDPELAREVADFAMVDSLEVDA